MRRLWILIKNEWPRYIIEVVVLIIGITLSFMANEWRLNNENKSSEIRLLEGLRNDLVVDSLALATDLQAFESGLKQLRRVFDPGEFAEMPPDSFLVVLLVTVSYSAFQPQDITYEEMRQTGSSRLITNKQILNQVITLYHTEYGLTGEILLIDRDFILNRMLPYLDKHLRVGLGGDIQSRLPELKKDFERMLAQQQFKNMLNLNRNFKTQIMNLSRNNIQQITGLIRTLDAELLRLQ